MAREGVSALVTAVESRIEQVTLYATGARVRRTATLHAPLRAAVRFVGLPVTMIDDTVRAEVDGPATVIALRAGVEAPDPSSAAAEQAPELRAARRRVMLAEADVERIGAALAQLADASIVEPDPSDAPPATWAAVMSARRKLVTLRAERELALCDRQAAARRELAEATRALEIASEHDRRSGNAHAAKLHELRKHVELEVTATGTGDVTIHLEYQVAAARWAPCYVARLEADQAGFELRAVVAQASGEDWTGVALRLSTAEPERFSQLPELAAQKIGRRQVEPVRRGFRAPPAGADALYADYDRGFVKRSARPKPYTATAVFDESTDEGAPMPPVGGEAAASVDDLARFEQQNWDEESSRARAFEPVGTPPPETLKAIAKKSRGGGAVFGGVMPGMAPAPMKRSAVDKSEYKKDDTRGAAPANAPAPRLDYAGLHMAPSSRSDRGRLVPAQPTALDSEIAERVARASAAIAELVLPRGCDAAWAHTYDYAFTTEGNVDVKSDGTWHSIAITARAGTARLHHVAVPREQADVFRVASIVNPFDGPLLPGPIDVYDRGQFLVTSDLDYTPPGGAVDIALGVDATVKIARNAEFREEASGMLRGVLKLVHALTIEVENLSARSIDLEVRERIPVSREGDDDVEVTLAKVDPAWERWTPDATAPARSRLRGGYRWKVVVPAKAKQLLRAGYEVKIAAKLELVGGNRREP